MQPNEVTSTSSSSPWSSILLYVGNLWYAVIKKSLASSTPLMQQQLGFTASDIGDFSASFSLCYGLFKLFGGLLSDIYPVVTLYSGCLMLGGVMNISIPLLYMCYSTLNKNAAGRMISMITMLKVCWSVNGVVQGAGGPALSKITIEYFSAEQRSCVWSALLTASNLGYLLAPYMLMYPLYTMGWQGPFLFAGVLGVAIAILMMVCPIANTSAKVAISNSPIPAKQDIPYEKQITRVQEVGVIGPSHAQPAPVYVSTMALQLAYAFTLVLAQAVVYFVVKSLSDWTVQYLMFGPSSLSYASAVLVGFWCEIGAISGQSLSGLVRGIHMLLVNVFFTLISLVGCVWCMVYAYTTHQEPSMHSAPSTYMLAISDALMRMCTYIPAPVVQAIQSSTSGYTVLVWSVLFFIVGFGINGPKSLLQLKATEQCICAYKTFREYYVFLSPHASFAPTTTQSDRKIRKQPSITGTLSGVVGLCAQFGASCSGLYMSSFIQVDYEYLWPVCVLLCASIVGMLCVCIGIEKMLEISAKTKSE